MKDVDESQNRDHFSIQKSSHTKMSQKRAYCRESHEGAQSTDFTRQAKQFSACLGSFIQEMRRCQRLFGTFRVHGVDHVQPPNGDAQVPVNISNELPS